ncbi:MAG: outer membrane beta-barrel protein [Thermaurantimonas sp.]
MLCFKKRNVTLFMFVMLAFSVQSQNAYNYRLGLYASTNITWVPLENELLRGPGRLGWGFGFLFNRFLNSKNAFALGLDIATLNHHITYPYYDSLIAGNPLTNVRIKNRFDYFSVPISYRMFWGEIGYHNPFVNFGFNLGFRRRQTVEYEPNYESFNRNINNGILFNLLIGAGTTYHLAESTDFFMELLFNRSLLNNIKESAVPELKGEQPRFSFVSLRVGILF